MSNEQLDRDREEHRDWLEGQASDQLEREAFERDGRRWGVTTSQFAFRDIIVRVGGVGVFEFPHDEAVRFAHAILAEVEIAQIAQRAEQEYDERHCECEIDWNCPLHQGGPTAIERQNDAWASEQTEIDRTHGM